jgi:hypothetical protein
MTRLSILLCAAALSFTPVGSLHAQGQPQEELEHPKLGAKACADRERLAFGDAVHLFQRDETTGAASNDLSETLGRSDGIICPPQDLDPNIHAPAPGGGRTPTIPPSAVEPPGSRAK